MADSTDPRVVLISKPGCHLCDEARAVVSNVCEQLHIDWREESIIGNPRWASRYADFIPVVLVDGDEHAMWRVDPGGLTRALTKESDR